ncbi:GNAT family N-acetyltransferase [Pontibacter sp. SGAir0037]|uniref:GNAT family N-acetyltransferase n=1 Tax=Pontibacter sp. SGAir0037 TaxID=2571030 RepID=UPI0010CCD982|nr:GNAT family N-acetyltransferase [Pontibacter sp. SGAir0037]QCR24155.1 GNAT family N-acetyltransferase [Pontibacter sp. SGAir0037]
MIYYLPHNLIDKQQWDDLITVAPEQQVYALSWYLDVVSPGWEAIVAVDTAGRYEVVLPVPVRQKLRMRYVQQPLYCQQLGFYSRSGIGNQAIVAQMLEVLYQRYSYVVSLPLNTANSFPEKLLHQQVSLQNMATLYLSLSERYPKLYANYSRDRKLNLKRAQRVKLSIAESEDIEPLISFFKEEVAGRIYGGVGEWAYTTLRNLYRELKQRGLARLLYTVDAAGNTNAGCLFVIFQKRIIYIFNAASKDGRKYNGRTFMLDYIIQQYAGQDYLLDFESPAEEERAIVRVYAGFGATKAGFAVVHYNRLPPVIKLVRELRMRLVRRFLL